MQRKMSIKRIGAFLLCVVMLLGNILSTNAAEETPLTINIHTRLTNATAIFDKPNYLEGDSVNVTITPDEGYLLSEEEMEVYNNGDLSTEDTELGEDIGKEHQVTTSREYEPDVALGKSAKWDDIEKGTATLTLTQKTSSDWSDNPSDYIIVLDRTVSMVVDHTVVYGRNTDTLGFGCSVCLNPNHFYMYNGKPAKLIDYGHGFYISSGEYFSTASYMGSEDALWERHYDSTGKRIAPRVYNSCIDRLSIAQNSIKSILDVLNAQNQKELAGGKKNRVMYWSFSGANDINDGIWDEVPEFTEDMEAVKEAIKYEGYPGTYYYRSFEQIQQKLMEKQEDAEYKEIPTKVIFISDGMLYDENPDAISEMAKNIRETPNTKLYTILIGNSKDSEAGKVLKSYATSPAHFATVTSNWDVFVDTITAIQKDQFEIRATEKVVTDKIHTKYWEVVGEPILESGSGTASLDDEKTILTWKIPDEAEKTYSCKLKLKLKDEYRYLLTDTSYPTNADEENATDEMIFQEPTKAGATVKYKILGGKYNGETRTVGVKSPELKYGTVHFEGDKKWTVDGSNSESMEIRLKRTMPGAEAEAEVNNTITNVTKNWKYTFQVRQLPDGTTYPLIKYNNAGAEISYEVSEIVPEYYKKIDEKQIEADGKVITDFYNEPFKVKAQITKIDEETKNLLSGAEFSVYAWSEKSKSYIPYKGTDRSMTGAESVVNLKEESKGVYTTPVWLYYAPDNLGKFRIIETKAPKGYFGDWKEASVTSSDNDKNVYDFVISGDSSKNGETIVLSNAEEGKFSNQRVKGQIIFTKLDFEGKISEAQGEASLSGAVYKLYAAEDIVHQDGTTGVLYKKDQEVRVSATANLKGVNVYKCDPNGNSEIKTGSAATVRIDDLELGKYYLKEVKASKGYLVDPQKYEIDVAYMDEKTEAVSVNTEVYERVMKQSLSFYKYTSDANEDVLEPMKGAKFSVYLVSELENGRYKELSDEDLVQAIIDDLRNPVTLQYDTYKKYSPARVYASEDSDDVTSGRLIKEVSYGEDKTYQASGKNAYLVAELESDSNGVVKVPGLPFGRYIVIETTTPAGKITTRPFVINVTCDEKDGTVDGDGEGTPLQDRQLTVLIDRPIMSLVRIMKRDSFSKNIVLKEDASYVIHDAEGAWFDYISNEMTTAQKKAYKEKYGDLVAQYSQGTYYGTRENPFATKIVQGAEETQNVYIETPMQLPSGIYELEEISAPDGYILQGHEGVIAKKSADNGNGTYYETAEEGKWKDTPQGRVKFLVSNNESIYDEEIRSFVTTVRQDNNPAVGKISIFAEGEKLLSAKKGIISEEYKFEYGLKPIEGAQFEIRSAEDIYSQEGGSNAVRLFEKGDLVVTLTTDENGQTWTGQEDWEGTDIAKGLPLGKYTVTQVVSGEGFYLSEENAKPLEVEISYVGQEVPVIYKSFAYINPRQTVKIEVEKIDAETETQLSGAVFGLYTKEEIRNFEGKTVVKADTLLETVESDKNGKAAFTEDLPCGKYYVKEIKAAEGYLENSGIFEFDASYTGENGEKTLEFYHEMMNRKAEVQIRKTDLYTGKDIEGAKLCVLEKNSGRKVAEWITDGKLNTLEGLKLSGSEEAVYVLKEMMPAEGYVTANDIEFKLVQNKDEEGQYLNTLRVFVRENGKWKELSENVIEMKDDVTKIEVQKVDRNTKKLLAGAKLELRDSAGKVVAVWTSSEKSGFSMERLPIGTYRILETEKMDGYTEAKPYVVKVLDTDEKQVFIFENTPEKKVPETVSGNEPKHLPKVIIQQIAAVATGDYAPVALCAIAVAASLAGLGITRKRRK